MCGTGIANGTFGELLQGMLSEEESHFLVTLPIADDSVAKFSFCAAYPESMVYPVHKKKARHFATKLVDYYKIPFNWKLEIASQIPEGKGLASSSADLVATARAISNAVKVPLPINILLNILSEIEPTDGVMYDDIVCFFHRKVSLHSRLGVLPNLTIIAIDEGGEVDTIEFNNSLGRYSESEKAEYKALLNIITEAVTRQDLKTIGQVATRSAMLNQKFNPKKNLDQVVRICKEGGGLGVVVAHSGTYIGILMDNADVNFFKKEKFIVEQLKKISPSVTKFNTNSGMKKYA